MQGPTVSIHALHAGYLTLPERFFVSPLHDQNARKTVPSLSFLIQHPNQDGSVTRIVFDLGIRRDIAAYSAAIQKHASTRQPLNGMPDVVESLAAGSLTPDDIDVVLLSHVHWDHIGMPSDFQRSYFIVGDGALSLLDGTRVLANGSHSHFEPGLLPLDRTLELPPVGDRPPSPPYWDQQEEQKKKLTGHHNLNLGPWKALRIFSHTVDLFGDGSVHVVNAPGHLPGHINLLCKVGRERYVYLAGDSCHDTRLLSGQLDIAEWTDPDNPNITCCIHADRRAAEQTIGKIRSLQENGEHGLGDVEVIFAHDAQWAAKAESKGRYFPGSI